MQRSSYYGHLLLIRAVNAFRCRLVILLYEPAKVQLSGSTSKASIDVGLGNGGHYEKLVRHECHDVRQDAAT